MLVAAAVPGVLECRKNACLLAHAFDLLTLYVAADGCQEGKPHSSEPVCLWHTGGHVSIQNYPAASALPMNCNSMFCND
jgi:hypothetical protein